MEQDFQRSSLALDVLRFRCPRWAELPGIALYMDQVTGYINDVFAPIAPQDQETTLTKAMVNNYVKLRVMSAPVKKKYDRSHVAYLVTICALKQVFSLPEIASLIRTQIQRCPVEQAYDCFCEELEQAFHQVFCGEIPTPDAEPMTDELALLRSTVRAYANKVYIQKRLAFAEEQEQPQEIE